MEPFCGVEALHAVPDAQEGFLHQVFGDAGVAHHAQDQRVGDAAVAIVEFGERLRIAPLQARDEVAIVAGDVNREEDGKQNIMSSLASSMRASRIVRARLIVYTSERGDQDLRARSDSSRAMRATRVATRKRSNRSVEMHFFLDFLLEQPYI